MLHAVVDCIWVRKPGATVEEYQGLADRIAASTRIPAVLEGVYRWLHFLPSQTNPLLGVPNRYVGVFQDGSLKVRGLALRRRDTPRFICRAQEEVLRILSAARDLREYRDRLPQAQSVVAEVLESLRAGLLPFEEVVITRSLSQDPAEYRKASPIAIVAGELAKRGVPLRAGETIQYVVTDARAKDVDSRARAYAFITPDWSYDVEFYEEQLTRTVKEVLDLPGPAPERESGQDRLDIQ